MTVRSFVAGLTLLAASSVTPASLAQKPVEERYVSPWKTPWDYEGARGPEHWSGLDPGYAPCNTGREQSPIDIRNAEKAALPVLRMESRTGQVTYVINNGHTIRVNYRPGNANFLFLDNNKYELTQFHFHHPSEEYVDGKPFLMEVHLMYQSQDGKVAGVTVFVKPGSVNAAVQKLWEHMPRAEGQQDAGGIEITPAALLPREVRPYYMYTGSVTAPPCTEGVTWLVMKHTIEMSVEQINSFATLYPNDARPLQPRNNRVIKESQ